MQIRHYFRLCRKKFLFFQHSLLFAPFCNDQNDNDRYQQYSRCDSRKNQEGLRIHGIRLCRRLLCICLIERCAYQRDLSLSVFRRDSGCISYQIPDLLLRQFTISLSINCNRYCQICKDSRIDLPLFFDLIDQIIFGNTFAFRTCAAVAVSAGSVLGIVRVGFGTNLSTCGSLPVLRVLRHTFFMTDDSAFIILIDFFRCIVRCTLRDQPLRIDLCSCGNPYILITVNRSEHIMHFFFDLVFDHCRDLFRVRSVHA